MDRWFQEFKSTIVNYKLDLCCWLLPMRVGCVVTAVFNIVTDFVSMVGVANEGFSPTITKLQEALFEDNVTKPPTILAYTMELAMNVVFLCATYRKDIILLRVFMYYSITALAMSFLIYSIIIAAVPLELAVVIIIGPIFQAYTILLVRSYIVEVKLQNKKYQLPTLVMRTISDKESNIVVDKEIPENKEVVIIVPDEKENKELVTKVKLNEIKVIDPTYTNDIKDESKPKIYEFKKVDRKFFEVKKHDKEETKNDVKELPKLDLKVTEPKIEVKGVVVPKVEEEHKPGDKNDKEKLKDDKKAKESKDNKKTKQVKEDNKTANVPKDDNKKDSVSNDDKDKESKETLIENKPKEKRSIQSLFSRKNKKNKNDEKTESVNEKEKLATVNEDPKESN